MPPCPRLLFQGPRYSTVGGGLLLGSSGMQPRMGAEEVGVADVGVGERGIGCPDVDDVLRCIGVDSIVVQVGDMFYVHANWEELWRFPLQGGLHTD